MFSNLYSFHCGWFICLNNFVYSIDILMRVPPFTFKYYLILFCAILPIYVKYIELNHRIFGPLKPYGCDFVCVLTNEYDASIKWALHIPIEIFYMHKHIIVYMRTLKNVRYEFSHRSAVHSSSSFFLAQFQIDISYWWHFDIFDSHKVFNQTLLIDINNCFIESYDSWLRRN